MTTIEDYVRALESALRDQPRRVRRTEAAGLREHLSELPPGVLAELDDPRAYACEYRARRGLRRSRLAGAWRAAPITTRIALVVLPITLVAVVAIPAWIAHYQPVTIAISGGGSDVTPRFEHDATVYAYRDGAHVRITMSIENPGPLDATISGYDDETAAGVLKLADVRIYPRGFTDCCLPEAARATSFPLHVRAGGSLLVVLELRMTNCEYYGRGDAVGYDQLRFPMKILDVHHTLVAHLHNSAKIFVDMPGPATRACPRARPTGA